MKSLSLIAALLFVATAFAQVSSKATNFLNKKYPSATNVTWNETEDGYEAEFEVDKEYLLARFDNSSNWIVTRGSITDAKLPKAVSEACYKNYVDGIIESVDKIEDPTGIRYEVMLSEDDSSYILLVTQEGKVIDTTTIELEDDDFD